MSGSSMGVDVWNELKHDPNYTALVGEFQEPPETEVRAATLDDVLSGADTATISAENDAWSKAEAVAMMVAHNPTAMEFLIESASDWVLDRRQESADSENPDSELRTKLHFEASGAKKLLNYITNFIETQVETAANPNSILSE